jgi:hypothetical protein
VSTDPDQRRRPGGIATAAVAVSPSAAVPADRSVVTDPHEAHRPSGANTAAPAAVHERRSA